MYKDIIFSSKDAWGRYIYSFRVNMRTHELSVEYRNNQGGYTTNGITIPDEKIRYFKAICDNAIKFFKAPIFEKDIFPLDPNTWELRIIRSDGLPTEELKQDNNDIYVTPDFVEALVCLVMDLATFDNKGFKYF